MLSESVSAQKEGVFIFILMFGAVGIGGEGEERMLFKSIVLLTFVKVKQTYQCSRVVVSRRLCGGYLYLRPGES